jgi:predicted RNase H-like nuclease (RuvC/YqgF family)
MKLKLLLILPVAGMLSGCETLQTPQQRRADEARQQSASRMVEEKIYRLQGQVESVEMENARLIQEMQKLRNEMRALNSQVSQLGSGMHSLERPYALRHRAGLREFHQRHQKGQ